MQRPRILRTAVLCIILNAPNDRKGNARRLSLYLDAEGCPLAVDPHGSRGVLTFDPIVPSGPCFNVSPKEYTFWLRHRLALGIPN